MRLLEECYHGFRAQKTTEATTIRTVNGCTTVVHRGRYNRIMPRRHVSVRRKIKPVRQSVTVPAPLAAAVRRVAKERNMTMSRALVALAERGVQAEDEAYKNLKATYKRFLDEREPARKDEAGKDLIRAIFGKDAIAKDPFF